MRQMLLHTEAFEHRCLYTQKLLDTDCLSENHRSFDTEKPLHRESFTHRSFHKHRSFSTEAFRQRSFYTQELLHTDAFTHRSLYTRKLLRTEAFTQRSPYTKKPLHTDAFPQKKRFHGAVWTRFKKSQFYLSFWRLATISCERVAS